MEAVKTADLNLIAIPSKFHLTYLPFKGFCPLIKSAEINTVLNLIVLSWGSPLSRVFHHFPSFRVQVRDLEFCRDQERGFALVVLRATTVR